MNKKTVNHKAKTLTNTQCKYIQSLIDITIESALGGKNSISYRMLYDKCKKGMIDDIECEFGIRNITELCYNLFPCVLNFIASWFPDDETMELSREVEGSFNRYIYKFVDDIPKESPFYKEIMEDYINAVCTNSERFK